MAITRETSRAYKVAKEAVKIQQKAAELELKQAEKDRISKEVDAVKAANRAAKRKAHDELMAKWKKEEQDRQEQARKIEQARLDKEAARVALEKANDHALATRFLHIVLPVTLLSMLAGAWVGLSVGFLGTFVALIWPNSGVTEESKVTEAKPQDVSSTNVVYTKPNLFSGR